MSLPKQEVTLYLRPDLQAKLKAMAAAKKVSMKDYGTFFLERAIEQRWAEIVSVVRAVNASGTARDEPGASGVHPLSADFVDTGFDDGIHA